MKRLSGEAFEEYRERRKSFNKTRAFFGRTFNFIRIKHKPKPEKVRTEPTNKAVGKRHKNESPTQFRKRRLACNAKRRMRESAHR